MYSAHEPELWSHYPHLSLRHFATVATRRLFGIFY